MKKYNLKPIIGLALAVLFLTGCSDVLNETDREGYTPEYFSTEKGVKAGITALYSNLRYTYGSGYWMIACEVGTDEYTWGQGGDGNVLPIDLSGQGTLNASNCRADRLWDHAFTAINTASGVIQYGDSAHMDSSLLAEARFFRAFNYFELVQTFGGVPLNLGSGELKYNTTAIRTSTRNTVPEIYTKAVFPDLIKAVKDLPETGRVTGGVTKTAAREILSKAYLTYGWWLENPNNIPTYPTCDRTDPDGHDASWYYQQAYNIAVDAIKNPGNFKLQKSFYLVNVGSNDRNSEIVLYADHTEDSEYYSGGTSQTWSSGSEPGNFARFMYRWDYTFLESSTNSKTWIKARTVQREAVQGKDRPWKEMATPIEVSTNTFADKTYDSRYDGTFATQFKGNWEKTDAYANVDTMYNANRLPIGQKDSVLTFLDKDNENIVYPISGTANAAGDGTSAAGYSNVGAGVLPGRADYVIGPSGISRYAWLNDWKNGIYRTDNGTGLGKPNGDSPRPFPVLKFSELYLIAAEAAVKGATTESGYSARELVNVLRARAGVWTYDNNHQHEKTADYSKEMTEATPQTITIDYILAERSREFFGDGYRWWDLVRTQKWNDLAGTYTICGKNVGDHTPEKVTRTISSNDYLRPIPQTEIDALQVSDAEKEAYQNPGYE